MSDHKFVSWSTNSLLCGHVTSSGCFGHDVCGLTEDNSVHMSHRVVAKVMAAMTWKTEANGKEAAMKKDDAAFSADELDGTAEGRIEWLTKAGTLAEARALAAEERVQQLEARIARLLSAATAQAALDAEAHGPSRVQRLEEALRFYADESRYDYDETACHDLKTWPEPFAALLAGSKTFEIRKDDRGFEVGDCLHLREWDNQTQTYSERWINAVVTYKVPGGAWGLPNGLCVLSIRETARHPVSAPTTAGGGEVTTRKMEHPANDFCSRYGVHVCVPPTEKPEPPRKHECGEDDCFTKPEPPKSYLCAGCKAPLTRDEARGQNHQCAEPPRLGHAFTGGDQDGNCTMLYFYSRGPGDAPGNQWCGQPRAAHTEPEKP